MGNEPEPPSKVRGYAALTTMTTTLLHTADWHLGKTFHALSDDPDTQGRLRQERFAAVERIGTAARACNAAAVLVAGDVFHTNEVEDKWIVEALRAIGSIAKPVLAIPGNHDHAGGGSVWERRSFVQNQPKLAPNLTLVHDGLTKVTVGDVDVIARPVRQRFDRIALADLAAAESEPGRARIGLVHAATLSFDQDGGGRSLDLLGGEAAKLDYLALGDFHRQQQVEGMPCLAWYAGTPEPDGFPSHHQDGTREGSCLRIDVDGPGAVRVMPLPLPGGMIWLRRVQALLDGAAVAELMVQLHTQATARARALVCELDVTGSALSFADYARMQEALADLSPLLLALQVRGEIARQPDAAELHALASLPGIAGTAARRLHERAKGPSADLAQAALAQLFAHTRAGGVA
jgi:hypothetical protein